ncbi:integrase arm-type DNA-binding domain-containing protein [Luteimonas sp. MC1782]|uniref:tyrosine-type recombinase/integrase n=1 Tax=Luteimonas sp. MC1782 TaxID=2760305 RepID=UPI0016029E26|nr:integrase arm-type DNA-binding domain-containing protein [Luteimonas sp. MC1782]MBB1472390.1 integrase arm-type DNA-binding domain-containing protein [Luteimonas sp. MC1782]
MPLSDVAIRKAKPGIHPDKGETGKPYKLADAGGLYLEVMPTGGKLWRWKYRHAGKEKRLALGAYPDVTLAAARERHAAGRTLLAAGIDPGEQRKAEKAATVDRAANTFAAVATEMMAQRGGKLSVTSQERATRLLGYLSPIANMPIAAVDGPLLLAALRKIEARGGETTHRARAFAGQVFRYGIATGRNTGNPARDLLGALTPVKGGHFASLTDPATVAPLLRALWGYQGGPVVQAALKVAPLVFVRPGELRTARWAEIDLDAAEWRFTASKTGTPHIVPLSTQAVEVLRGLQPLTGRGEYVFPSERGKGRPMSENTVNAALRALGYGPDTMTGHGFRAMARTILDEVLGFRPDYIEHQLAHAVRDPNGRAYNRTAHLPERRVMMQAWADYLDNLRVGGNVVAIRKAS